jgi:hypothetical protein
MKNRLHLGLWAVALAMGSISGLCYPEAQEVAEMKHICGIVAPTCRELCDGIDEMCVGFDPSDPRNECTADAWGLNLGDCEDGLDGVPLDVGCDDPLPYIVDDPNGFESFACCCTHLEF